MGQTPTPLRALHVIQPYPTRPCKRTLHHCLCWACTSSFPACLEQFFSASSVCTWAKQGDQRRVFTLVLALSPASLNGAAEPMIKLGAEGLGPGVWETLGEIEEFGLDGGLLGGLAR